jgi:hypothetical protein
VTTWPPNMRIRPIVTWPGEQTSDYKRKDAPFRAPFRSTVDLLRRELDQLRARNVVLQIAMAERDFRIDGYPRANARAEHPGVILSLDSKHGPLSYPCDRFWEWQDNLRAIALALEALRKVDRYGVTKHGEQYTGWKQLPSGRPMPAAMNRDDALVVLAGFAGWTTPADSADPAVIDLCYRTAAKRVHPDAGGTTADFQRLQEAKRVLDGAL